MARISFPRTIKKYKKTFSLIAGIIALIVLFLLLKPKQAEEIVETPKEDIVPTAIIEIFEGSPEVKLPNKEFKLAQNGIEIPAGTIVKTDDKSRAQILYVNKSVTRLDFNTEITLIDLDNDEFKAKVKLTNGGIWSRVAKLLGKESYETETDKLVATVRGTSYGHIITEKGNKIITTKSEVEGECINLSQKATVPFDKKLVFDCTNNKTLFPSTILYSDKDEWYMFNLEKDEELNEKYGEGTYDDQKKVLGTSTPKSTPTPTPTSTPTPAPSVTPTPTPNPIITSHDDKNCFEYNCSLIIFGNNFMNLKSVELINAKGVIDTGRISFSDTQIDSYFSKVPYGSYSVKVTTAYGSVTGGPISVKQPLLR
ncbi:MAG: Hemolysin-type calcium-binding region [Candidatus Woesebacteria bacterium GW2011_GWB1_43_14]|uniref:Hemolysin-type calcium-binding region n=1 Tax=Candidatus Woesebacteria bacterium GW2011_GWB1_43_14 TaxID=1618578 RepID=A0A0G1GDG7_9BACT|nr:MAG: Hemolysin-type calcium-binding region [Candidatus Woesebacteria bacterium GW2011_GWC1_42_9]KKS96928.1 MAG: Hemolysin-type calcium-binding region [Candidatus Woesebacteria bacterium GW2011_GWB1_43_14]